MNNFTVKHDDLEQFIIETLPHGSDIDCDWQIEITQNKVTCKNAFHCMNEVGYYVGYADFTLTLYRWKTTLLNGTELADWKVEFNGPQSQYLARKHNLREYLEDSFLDSVEIVLPEIRKNVNFQ